MKKMMRPFLMVVVAVGLIATAQAAEMPEMPYDSLMEDRVSADGWVEREEEFEYPAEFKNPATGLTVSWGFDDNYLYVALETKGKGWFSIGFGTADMNGSNMMMGYYTDDSADVYNLVGKGYTHGVAGHADDVTADWDVDYDDETKVRCFEFIYPLTWRGEGVPEELADNEALAETAVPGLVPGDVFDLVLAQNTKTVSMAAKHTHRAELKFKMGENPNYTPAGEEGE